MQAGNESLNLPQKYLRVKKKPTPPQMLAKGIQNICCNGNWSWQLSSGFTQAVGNVEGEM